MFAAQRFEPIIEVLPIGWWCVADSATAEQAAGALVGCFDALCKLFAGSACNLAGLPANFGGLLAILLACWQSCWPAGKSL